MAESKAAWEQVGEDFRALGRQVKQHYDQRDKPEGPGEPQAAAPAGAPVEQQRPEQSQAGAQGDRPDAAGGEGRQGPDRRKVDEALQKLSDALDQAFTALGDAVRDPQVGEQTKKAASSLSDALTATFAEASERFRKR